MEMIQCDFNLVIGVDVSKKKLDRGFLGRYVEFEIA